MHLQNICYGLTRACIVSGLVRLCLARNIGVCTVGRAPISSIAEEWIIMKQRERYFKSLTFVSVLFSLLMLSVGIAFGQAISGNLVGTVSDASGAVVANAEVSATNLGTNASVVTHTN